MDHVDWQGLEHAEELAQLLARQVGPLLSATVSVHDTVLLPHMSAADSKWEQAPANSWPASQGALLSAWWRCAWHCPATLLQ